MAATAVQHYSSHSSRSRRSSRRRRSARSTRSSGLVAGDNGSGRSSGLVFAIVVAGNLGDHCLSMLSLRCNPEGNPSECPGVLDQRTQHSNTNAALHNANTNATTYLQIMTATQQLFVLCPGKPEDPTGNREPPFFSGVPEEPFRVLHVF